MVPPVPPTQLPPPSAATQCRQSPHATPCPPRTTPTQSPLPHTHARHIPSPAALIYMAHCQTGRARALAWQQRRHGQVTRGAEQRPQAHASSDGSTGQNGQTTRGDTAGKLNYRGERGGADIYITWRRRRRGGAAGGPHAGRPLEEALRQHECCRLVVSVASQGHGTGSGEASKRVRRGRGPGASGSRSSSSESGERVRSGTGGRRDR